jgi:hypothetical protein
MIPFTTLVDRPPLRVGMLAFFVQGPACARLMELMITNPTSNNTPPRAMYESLRLHCMILAPSSEYDWFDGNRYLKHLNQSRLSQN